MKFSSRIVETVEMTADEYADLWTSAEKRQECGIVHWLRDDGNNEIRFVGEDFYRHVCLVDAAPHHFPVDNNTSSL